MVRTDHVLFIASGAFTSRSRSDLIPSCRPVPDSRRARALRVEEFIRILTEPSASLTRAVQELLATERFDVTFEPSGVRRLAEVAFQVNDRSENIGARRPAHGARTAARNGLVRGRGPRRAKASSSTTATSTRT
jgi:ATP-dependent HslUV protease ATP-binding subunit HslU